MTNLDRAIHQYREDEDGQIKNRLEYLRQELRKETISYGELIELENLKEYIDKGDIELLQAINVEE